MTRNGWLSRWSHPRRPFPSMPDCAALVSGKFANWIENSQNEPDKVSKVGFPDLLSPENSGLKGVLTFFADFRTPEFSISTSLIGQWLHLLDVRGDAATGNHSCSTHQRMQAKQEPNKAETNQNKATKTKRKTTKEKQSRQQKQKNKNKTTKR